MRYPRQVVMSAWLVLPAALLAVLLIGACAGAPEEEPEEKAGRLEQIAGTDRYQVRLTEQAARRLGIQTGSARDVPGTDPGVLERVIPFAAVLYEPSGTAFTYVNPEPLVFVRQPITVKVVRGEEAVLGEGPPPGTAVVTVGAAELSGIETSGFEE